MTVPPVMHLMASLADGIVLKTWHLVIQETRTNGAVSFGHILRAESFLPVQGMGTSILLWSKQRRMKNFGNFLWTH